MDTSIQEYYVLVKWFCSFVEELVISEEYLKTFGFSVNNEIFAENSWYFRNSLARANYNDLGKGISATTIYLERFFENLLMGYQNEVTCSHHLAV